jgi:hypothetical protein
MKIDGYIVEQIGQRTTLIFDPFTKKTISAVFGGVFLLTLWIGYFSGNVDLQTSIMMTGEIFLLAMVFLYSRREYVITSKDINISFILIGFRVHTKTLSKQELGRVTYGKREATDGGEGIIDKVHLVTIEQANGKKWTVFKLVSGSAAKKLQKLLKEKLSS